MFYPNRRLAFIIAITCLAASLGLASLSFRQIDILALLGSAVMLGISWFFFVPIIKNQTVEFIDGDKIIIGNFGKMITIDVNDLYQILKRSDGAISYRFHKADFQCQITPHAYHQAETLQERLDCLFKRKELAMEVIEEG